jgi:Ca2+-binding RTX toxin-like protein
MQIAGTNLETALRNAISGGYVAEMSGQTYTVTQPIVINVTSTMQGPLGIDLGGATIVSQITNGAPVIQINVGPGVDLRYLTLSNFTIQGNGSEGDGIQIVADGNDRWIYNFELANVTVRGVGGYGLDVRGSVFEGMVSNSSMIGNRLGGAYFGHLDSGGQVSALRWFGGTIEGNGGAGIFLGNGARDLSVDGVTFANNSGYGISAEWGITSVTDSVFRDNRTTGIWFQNFGYFNNNTFTTSGIQGTGIAGYVTSQTTVTGSRSVYTGSGSDPTVLANLQGFGGAYLVGDTGKIVTGSALAVSGLGGGNAAEVIVSNLGASVPWMSSLTSVASSATASSTGTGTLETALRTALTGGTVAALSGASFTVTTPIVIYLTGSSQGPIGIDLGGAKIISQVTGGRPVIEIVAGPGVNVSNLTLSNFSIFGNGQEGDGIKIVAAGTDRSINLSISNVEIEHVGGIGLDVLGNVSGTVFDSWMHGNAGGGARFANSGGGTADALQWIGGGFRKNGVAGLILDNGARDMSVQGAYFVENYGAGIYATTGITLVEQSGFENNAGAGAWVGGSSTFLADTFSTYGPQTVGIAGTLNGGKVISIGSGNEYYGGGSDPTAYMNLQGSGTLSLVGGGKVIAGSGISVTGGSDVPSSGSSTPPGDTVAPAIVSIAASGAGIAGGTGNLNAGDVISLTVTFSEAVSVSGGTPNLVLNDGGTATYTSGSGSTALVFTHAVQAGQNVADLAVTSLSLNGAVLKDAAGNLANTTAATGYNPAGTLRIDTIAPTVASIATSGSSLTAGSGTVGVGATVTFTVAMSEAVTVTGTPTLSLSSGGKATYTGGSGSPSLVFTHTVASGQSAADLTVTSFNLEGSTVSDVAGNAASLSGATNYNPAGTLTVDTSSSSPPITGPVTVRLASDTGASSSDRLTANPALTGTANPYAVVSFQIDGQAIATTATANASGVWSFTPSGLGDGQHTVVAGGTASLNFTLDRTPPAPAFTSISAGNKTTLSGTSSAGDQVSIYDGGSLLGTTTTASNGTWSFTANAAAGTTHAYDIKATDLAGNTGSGTGRALLGSKGADTLTGTTGNDVIAGGPGSDNLTGGGGADIFAFTVANGTVDRITDFASGTDKLAFARSAFSALAPGELSTAAFVQAAAALTSEQRIIYNQSTGVVSYDADGSGGGAAITVAQLNAGQILKPQDIKVY